MYDYIIGKVVSQSPTVIEANNIGYRIEVPVDQISQLTDQVKLYLSFVVRETSHSLYGFLTREDRDFFEQITHISGIGPKMALAILSHLPLVKEAMGANSPSLMAKIPGVGKKTAERLLVELKGKLPITGSTAPTVRDAMMALLNLGYSQAKAQQAVQKSLKELGDAPELDQLITASLKHC